tara:strand:+ start:275 stop:457 length:183 start_codon:yes stop_codon:yes gene_type:complete
MISRLDFELVDKDAIDFKAFMNGTDSIEAQAIRDADSHDGEVKFYVAENKLQKSVLVWKI